MSGPVPEPTHDEIRELLGVTGINPGGTMTYAVALNWVNALNNFDHGRGLLGHHDWQLPVTPKFDSTNCSSNDNGTFGVLCSGSALGNPTCEGSSHSERIRSSNSG